MSRYDPKVIYDGFSLIQRGVNSGLAPVSIGRDQLAKATNATFRNGYATHRPGWVRRSLDFSDSDDPLLQGHFEDAIFQGAVGFERRNQIVVTIGGRLFRIRLDNWSVMNISTVGDLNPANRYRAWLTEAEDFVIVQDGQSAPWFYNGASTVRSDTFGIDGERQAPAGQSMVYSGGRLVVVLPDARQFVVGDIVGGDSGTPAYNFRDAIIYFTENDIIDGGGAFSTPINAGSINALRPVAQVDTSTGQGPTQVFTTSGVFSLNTPTERTAWATVNFPLGTVSMVQAGSLSDRATVNVNGDIWFRALDGIRSFIVARRDFSTSWVNAPMSREVEHVLNRDDKNLLTYASAAFFDGRLLMTVQPYRRWNRGICHRGLASLDFAPLAFIHGRTDPAWDGLWCGVQILQILSGTFDGVERCFLFALNDDYKIELWEITKNRTTDLADSTETAIEWSLETGAYNFPRRDQLAGAPGQDFQRLTGGELYVDNLDGAVTFDVDYRADQDPCWRDWHSWSVCATTTTCGTTGSFACATPNDYRKQYRKPFRLPTPEEACDSVVNKVLNAGREFQARLTITGSCRIKRLELIAHDEQENVNDLCAEFEYCQGVTCCDPDELSYEIASTYNDGDGSYLSSTQSFSGDGYYSPVESGSGDVAPIDDDSDDPETPEDESPEPLAVNLPASLATGTSDYQPTFADPTGVYRPVGVEPLSGVPTGGDPDVDGFTALEAGVLDAWAGAVWAQWEAYKLEQGITVSYEQAYWVFNESPSLLRWHANSIWGEVPSWTAATFSWEIWISYTTA